MNNFPPPAGNSSGRVRQGELPLHPAAGLRQGGRADHHQEETQPHPQRGRLHRCLLRGSPQEQVGSTFIESV